MNEQRFLGEVEEGLVWFVTQLRALVRWFRQVILK